MTEPTTQAAHSGTCPSDCSAFRLLSEVLSGLSVNGALGKIAVVYDTGEVSREGTRAMMDQIAEWRRQFREMQNKELTRRHHENTNNSRVFDQRF